MGAELLRGQNHPLSRTRLDIRVTAAVPLTAGVILGSDGPGAAGTSVARLAHPGAPALPGVEVPDRPAATHRITVDLDALDLATAGTGEPADGGPAAAGPEAAALAPDAYRLTVLLTLSGARDMPATFGAMPAPRVTVSADDGVELAAFRLTGLGAESAVAALEFYRRGGGWRVRAVGQGYAEGLARMLADYGLPAPARLAAEFDAAVRAAAAPDPGPGIDRRHPGRPAPRTPGVPAQRSAEPVLAADRPDPGGPVAGDAPGWTMEERLYNQVWGMFEDLARRIAAYRSAVDFAESRLERELDGLLADRSARSGPAAEAARDQAQARRDELTDQARAALDHDLAQLTAESEVVETALPPPYAGWESPVWHGYGAPAGIPMAVRLGDIHLPEVPELRIPMLVRLPLERGLWVDSGSGYGAEPGGLTEADADHARWLATGVAVALAVRLLAAHPVGGLTVHLVDPAGSAIAAFAPLARSGALREWSGAGATGVPGALDAMTRRVDLVQMALRAGAPEALPPDLDTATQLLVVSGFPYDFDDRAVTQLRYLADEGPAAGVHLMLIADRADAQAYGPVLDPLWRSLLRLTPLPDDHLADPWVGHAWTYEPSQPPEGSSVLERVLGGIAEARQQAHGG